MTARTIQSVFAALLIALASMACAAAATPQLNLKFDKLEEALDLTPAQKDQYDIAVGASKRALMQLALAGMQAKQRIAEELAKPRPDLDVLAEIRRSIVDDGRALRLEARAEWRRLYAMLDADQVATFKRFIQEQVDQFGLLHDFMMQLLLGADR